MRNYEKNNLNAQKSSKSYCIKNFYEIIETRKPNYA